jgi:hypothetical protein
MLLLAAAWWASEATATLVQATSSTSSLGSGYACDRSYLARSVYRVWQEAPGQSRLEIVNDSVIDGANGTRITLERVDTTSPIEEFRSAVSYSALGDVVVDQQGTLRTPRHSAWRFVDPDNLSIIGRIDVLVNGDPVACFRIR